jgi:hypothetical protein
MEFSGIIMDDKREWYRITWYRIHGIEYITMNKGWNYTVYIYIHMKIYDYP